MKNAIRAVARVNRVVLPLTFAFCRGCSCSIGDYCCLMPELASGLIALIAFWVIAGREPWMAGMAEMQKWQEE